MVSLKVLITVSCVQLLLNLKNVILTLLWLQLTQENMITKPISSRPALQYQIIKKVWVNLKGIVTIMLCPF